MEQSTRAEVHDDKMKERGHGDVDVVHLNSLRSRSVRGGMVWECSNSIYTVRPFLNVNCIPKRKNVQDMECIPLVICPPSQLVVSEKPWENYNSASIIIEL